MKKLHFLVAIVIASFATTQIHAQAGSSAPTTVCLPASQDALISEWGQNNNYGTWPNFSVNRWTYNANGGSGFYTTKVLHQFDLSTLPIGATITSAIMKLHVDVTAAVYNQHRDLGGGTGNGATVEQVGSAWNESTVTWVTAPTSFLSSTSIPSLGDGSTSDVVVDVTTMVQNMLTTGINNGFQLSMTDNSDYYHSLVFGSRENANYQPELCVTYSTSCIDWSSCGNTIIPTDFLGTLNNQPLNIKTNNIDRAIITATGEMGIGTTTPTSQLDVTSIPSGGSVAISGKGKNIGVSGEAFEMTLAAVTQQGIDRGDKEAIGVFGKGTYTTTSGNGNVFGVAGSAVTANPLNNIGVFGEAKNGNGYNTGVIGWNDSTTGIYNTGTSGYVALNPTGVWSRAIAGYAPVAPNHFAGYFEGKVAIVDGTQANNYVLTSDANGLASWTNPSLLGGSGWALNGNAATPTDFLGTTNTNPLNFVVNNVKSMSLDNGGNVSISTGGISTYQKLYVETSKQNDGIQVNQTGDTAATMDLNASGGSGKRWALMSTGSGNSQGAGHLLFWDWTTNQEQMRIDTNGKIVMGNVTTPAGYKLYVEQGILTEKVKVAVATSPAWADYVFANDYKLKPLSEVETYVKENKHLPNVPSADELVKDGLDLGKMQATQMAKIEELTLYMIEMKKEIEVLKKQNGVLTSQISKK